MELDPGLRKRKSTGAANPKAKLRAGMAAVTAAFSFVGFQLFIMFLIKSWRLFYMEAAIAIAVGGLLGWAFFPKTVGKCIKIGVITGLATGYGLIILASKAV